MELVVSIESGFARDPLGQWADADEVPAGLALVYDFVNTLDERVFHAHALRRDRRDLIDEPEALGRWLVARGLPAPASAADVEAAREPRWALREAIAANSRPGLAAAARQAMDRAGRRLPLRLALDGTARPRLEPVDGGVRGALATVLAQVVEASERGAWTRLKMCAADDCRWVFYDASRPRLGRWCEMASCGNRAKTREYRQRRRRAAG